MIVVLPSSREINLRHLSPLVDIGARFIVIDDDEGSISINHPQFEVYNWGNHKEMLGKIDCAIRKRNGACRDFGFYLAYRSPNDNAMIVSRDDAFEVNRETFAAEVKQALSKFSAPTLSWQLPSPQYH